jgi:hypothetical protein
MKSRPALRLLAVSLMTVLLVTSAPPVRAAVVYNRGHSWEKHKDKDKDKGRETRQVPEGSAGALLILAAGALAGGVLVWRRKRSATVA